MALSDEQERQTSVDFVRVAILKTLIYSDIFNFPLTKDEIWKYLISDREIKHGTFDNALKTLINQDNKTDRKKAKVSFKDGYFCLSGHEASIEERKSNKKYVEAKLKIAIKAASRLSHISSILFIGLSGGLAMGDVNKSDDIDFFIITKKDALFKTRLLVLFVLQKMGFRRKRIDKNPKDKICVNFLIDEKKLFLPLDRHDIYTAHEILQIKPLFERDRIYERFLKANQWIYNFLPNANLAGGYKNQDIKKNIIYQILGYFIDFLPIERPSRHMQMAIMKKHRRGEIVTKHVMVFNPNDYRVQTLKRMRLKLREIGLLTKI